MSQIQVVWIDGQGQVQELDFPDDESERPAVERAREFADELRSHMRGTVRVLDLSYPAWNKRILVKP